MHQTHKPNTQTKHTTEQRGAIKGSNHGEETLTTNTNRPKREVAAREEMPRQHASRIAPTKTTHGLRLGLFAAYNVKAGKELADVLIAENGRIYNTREEAEQGGSHTSYRTGPDAYVAIKQKNHWEKMGKDTRRLFQGGFAVREESSPNKPNAELHYDKQREKSTALIVRATRRINKDEEIIISKEGLQPITKTQEPDKETESYWRITIPPRPNISPAGNVVSLTLFRSATASNAVTYNQQYLQPMRRLIEQLNKSKEIEENDFELVIFVDDSLEPQQKAQLQTVLSTAKQKTHMVETTLGARPLQRNHGGHRGYLMTAARFIPTSWNDVGMILIRDVNYRWTRQDDLQVKRFTRAKATNDNLKALAWIPPNYQEHRVALGAHCIVNGQNLQLRSLLVNALALECISGYGSMGIHHLTCTPETKTETRQRAEIVASSFIKHMAHDHLEALDTDVTATADQLLNRVRALSTCQQQFGLNWLCKQLRPDWTDPALTPPGAHGVDEYIFSIFYALLEDKEKISCRAAFGLTHEMRWDIAQRQNSEQKNSTQQELAHLRWAKQMTKKQKTAARLEKARKAMKRNSPEMNLQELLQAEVVNSPEILFSGDVEGERMMDLVLTGRKTVTRRKWLEYRRNVFLRGIGKIFRIKTAPQEKEEGWIWVDRCYDSTLEEVTDEDVKKEGFGHLTKKEFCELKFFKGVKKDQRILVIEFTVLTQDQVKALNLER